MFKTYLILEMYQKLVVRNIKMIFIIVVGQKMKKLLF